MAGNGGELSLPLGIFFEDRSQRVLFPGFFLWRGSALDWRFFCECGRADILGLGHGSFSQAMARSNACITIIYAKRNRGCVQPGRCNTREVHRRKARRKKGTACRARTGLKTSYFLALGEGSAMR